MYNHIPGERTSRHTMAIMLLSCITLMSLLAVGYFAWLLEYEREEARVVLEEVPSAREEVGEESVAPLFTYPSIMQPERFAENPSDSGATLVLSLLDDWQDANKDTGYCTHLSRVVGKDLFFSDVAGKTAFADTHVRSALVSYFAVSAEDESSFFEGIDAVLDNNDTFAQHASMCSAGEGARKFLLLDDIRTAVFDDGRESLQSYPEILEWSQQVVGDFSWIVYPVSAYPSMDGYSFYPDWHGEVLMRTGYGDAGYAHWEVQRLEVVSGIPTVNLLEKCSLEPTEDYADSIITCEVAYTQ